jgi:molybdopterin molybdotransferase
MTGSPCPEGADCVVPYEWLSLADGQAEIGEDRPLHPGQNVQTAGVECPDASLLLRPGSDLNPARIAAAASVGHTRVLVTPRPVAAVLSTGDELVPAKSDPKPWQIRESNAAGIECMLRGIAEVRRLSCGDDPADLGAAVAKALESADIVILSGGVSAGRFDGVPDALRDAGVREIFHHVAIRPGKPIWFGAASGRRPVFGLPGNPVSSLICARRFVVPMVLALAASTRSPECRRIRLGVDAGKADGLTQFVPARLESHGRGSPIAYPVPMRGSGDFVGLLPSDGFLELQDGRSRFHAGEAARFIPWGYPGACHA